MVRRCSTNLSHFICNLSSSFSSKSVNSMPQILAFVQNSSHSSRKRSNVLYTWFCEQRLFFRNFTNIVISVYVRPVCCSIYYKILYIGDEIINYYDLNLLVWMPCNLVMVVCIVGSCVRMMYPVKKISLAKKFRQIGPRSVIRTRRTPT